MILVLVAAAAASVVGAILALTARDARLALGWLGVTLVASGLVDDPLPALVPFSARLVGALLAIEILRIAVRIADGTSVVRRTRPSDPLLLAIVGLAGVAGGVLAETARIGAGAPLPAFSPIVLGAAFGLVATGLTPLLMGRDVLQLGVGATLVFLGAAIGRSAGAPGPTPLEGLIATGAVVALAAAVAGLLVAAATRERAEGVDERGAPIAKPRPPLARPAEGAGLAASFAGMTIGATDTGDDGTPGDAATEGLGLIPAAGPLVAKRRRIPAASPADLPAPRPPRVPRTKRGAPGGGATGEGGEGTGGPAGGAP